MIHINTFRSGKIIDAYITEDYDVPHGTLVGRQGNAVLINDGDVEYVISRPRIEGDILDVVPQAADAPEIDLSGYF